MLPVKAMKPIVLAKKNLIVSCPKHLSKFIIYNIIYNLFKQCYLKIQNGQNNMLRQIHNWLMELEK